MINYRYDEFLDQAQPVMRTDRIKVPATAPFHVKLRELPLETQPPFLLVADADATTSAGPDQDCSVFQRDNTNINDASLVVGQMNALAGGWLYRSFLRFDISSLPTSPAKVLLRLFCSTVIGDSPTQSIGIYRVTSSWAETDPTWTTQPTYNTSIMGSIAVAPRADTKGEIFSSWFESDITELYNLWKAGTNYGLMLKADETLHSFVLFASSEGGPNAPQLVIVEDGSAYRQLGQFIAPTGMEFAVSYPTGKLKFPATAAGLELDVTYLGMGSPVDRQDAGAEFVTAGTSSAYTVTSEGDRLELVPFLRLFIKMHTNCAAGATLNPDGWGDIPLTVGTTPVTSGQLHADVIYLAVYDGANFQVVIGA